MSIPTELVSELPRNDQDYILAINKGNPAVEEPLTALLRYTNSDMARRKTLERQQAGAVDFASRLSRFTEGETKILAKRTGATQLTDGCTVGCPWCGLCAKGHIKLKFSSQSIHTFYDKYGPLLPPDSMQYWATDPFEWSDNGLTYSHVILTTLKQTKQMPPISTAIPEGTEITVLQTLDLIDSLWRSGGPTAKIPEDMLGFRFSRTARNKNQIGLILNILRIIGASEDFLKGLHTADRNNDNVYKLGHFIKHPQRNPIKDAVTFGCFDGILVTPDKDPVALSMQCTTLQTPSGIVEHQLVPGELAVPVFLRISDYRHTLLDEQGHIFYHLLPPVTFSKFVGSRRVGQYTIPSVGRDALAFYIAMDNLNKITEVTRDPENNEIFNHLKSNPQITKTMLEGLKYQFWPRFIHRRELCRNQYSNCSDPEAIAVAKHFIGKIEDWFRNLNQLASILDPNLRNFSVPAI